MLLDVILTPAEIARLPQRDLSAATCVVFDVLRATSAMLTAFAHGAAEVMPVRTLDEAFAWRKEDPHVRLGGERNGERPDGFDHGNSPLEYRGARGARIVWTTTNGTLALKACEGADRVLLGALLNLASVAEELRWHEPEHVVLVCAGTGEGFALEDAYAAGCLVAELAEAGRSDAAQAALAVARAFPDPLDALGTSSNGRALRRRGRWTEVEWCARMSAYSIGAVMDGAIVRPIA